MQVRSRLQATKVAWETVNNMLGLFDNITLWA